MTHEHENSAPPENHRPAESAAESPWSRLEQRLLEAYDELWGGFVDPRDADDDGTRWLRLGGDQEAAGGGSTPFATEHEHREIRSHCRALALTHEYCINGHENRINYIVGSGHRYRAVTKKSLSVPRELADQVQEVLDQFIKVNQWHRRQQELVLRRDRDGEVFLRYFTGPDGLTRVRFVEPGQVSTPNELAQEPTASFGIQTDADDVETVLAYYVDGTPIDSAEIQHRKANVDGNVKRGLPLFYPVRKNLRRTDALLRNMSVVAEIQSAIAIIRKHRGGTRTAVQQFVQQQADATVTSTTGGRSHSWKRYAPGTILDAHGDVDYEFPAANIDASAFIHILQAELRAIASRLVMPEFMFTSDASNANFASTMVAEVPAVRMFERLQAQQIADDLEVMERVVKNAVSTGHLPPEAAKLVEIQAMPPSLAVRDRLAEAQAMRIVHGARILSPQTWSLQWGYDYDQEQANFAEHEAQKGLEPG